MTRRLLLLVLLLAACSSPSNTDRDPVAAAVTATPNEAPAATTTPIPEPTTGTAGATATPATPSPTPTESALRIAAPLYRAPRIRVEGWSPDGAWLAFWRSGGNEGPARLRFVAAVGGEGCIADGITTESIWDGSISWESAGELTVRSNTGAWRGSPCGEFAPVERATDLDAGQWLSPAGRYIARTTGRNEGQLIIATAAITDTASGEVVVTYPYSASIHDPHTGAAWLSENIFLLGPTLDGPQYLSAETGESGNVIRDLLGLEDARADDPWIIAASASDEDYHLLLEWRGGRAPLLLYHAERDTVEELPFRTMRTFTLDVSGFGFSENGEWLLVGDPADNSLDQSAIGDDFWLRRVDPPGGEARLLANGVGGAPLAPDGEFIAFFDQSTIWIYRFPTNELVGRWRARDRALVPIAWSPDGSRLAALGYGTATGDDGLFILAP